MMIMVPTSNERVRNISSMKDLDIGPQVMKGIYAIEAWLE